MGSTIDTDARTSSFPPAAMTKAAAKAAEAASASELVATFMSTGVRGARATVSLEAGVTGRSVRDGPEGGRLPPATPLPDDGDMDNALLGRDRPPKPSARLPALADARAHGAGSRVGTVKGDTLPSEEEVLGSQLVEFKVGVSGSVINMLLCCS